MSLKKKALDELIEVAIECPDHVRPSMLDVIAELSKQYPISRQNAISMSELSATLDDKQRSFRTR